MAPRLPTLAAGLLLPSFAATTTPTTDRVQIDGDTGLFRDEKGRTRIFHGMNVVYKESPWYPPSDKFSPDTSLDPKTMDLMHKWGFNVVRLGVMWPGVEPSKGRIDDAYLTEVARLSGELGKHGIYTLVDLHQDVGSRRFCGEGFPEFYMDDLLADPKSNVSKAAKFPKPQLFDIPLDSSGNPPLSECLKRNFAAYYLTDESGAMWGELYRPGSALNEGFSRYWEAVAKTFSGAPQVVGYELLNEPSGYCLEPGTASCLDAAKAVFGNSVETNYLTPLYQAAARRIRAHDKATPIFYEPTTVPKPFSDVFKGPVLGDDPQQGLAYHIYCPPGDGEGPVHRGVCHIAQDVMTKLYYGFLHKYRRVGGFMTEFGAVGQTPGELSNIDRLLDFADGEFQSWAYWMLKRYHDFTTQNDAEALYDEKGKLQVEKLKTLSRTYAPVIAGTPKKMSFDTKTGAFELRFLATVSGAPTEIYLNEELHYPSGFDVKVSPNDCLVQAQHEANYVEFSLKEGAACQGQEVSITISRKPADGATFVV